ncbi:MAG: hypothetical protein RIT03_1197 [Bacteroidota bacterium]|jgi:hypothetical protein
MKDMKKYKVLLVFVCLQLVLGCSSDSVSPTPDPVDETPVNKTSTISYFVNGLPFFTQNNGVTSFRTENTFVINKNYGIEFSFDKQGQFGYLKIDLNTGTATATSRFQSATGFSSHYFDFVISSMDEVRHRVKGSFAGYLYADPLNLSSEKKFVSGEFDVYYYDAIPNYSGLKNSCKINGADWVKSNTYVTKGDAAHIANITQHDTNDQEYKLMVNYNIFSINLGTFDFTPTTEINRVQLAKFDVTTGQYVLYNCTGSMNIVQKEYPYYGNGDFLLKGTYSFTAVNPNNPAEVIQVTDGYFKLLYHFFY